MEYPTVEQHDVTQRQTRPHQVGIDPVHSHRIVAVSGLGYVPIGKVLRGEVQIVALRDEGRPTHHDIERHARGEDVDVMGRKGRIGHVFEQVRSVGMDRLIGRTRQADDSPDR